MSIKSSIDFHLFHDSGRKVEQVHLDDRQKASRENAVQNGSSYKEINSFLQEVQTANGKLSYDASEKKLFLNRKEIDFVAATIAMSWNRVELHTCRGTRGQTW